MSTLPPRAARLRAATALAAACVAAACSSFSPDGGMAGIERSAGARLGQPIALKRGAEAERRVAQLLAAPLAADDAVQVALLNNPGLQAGFAELGIAEAELVQAGRLPNPGFTFGRLTHGDALEIDRGIEFNLLQLLTMPAATRVAAQRFERMRQIAALQTIRLAVETRKAHIAALAAAQSAGYLAQVAQSAEASAELARRMAAAGNWSALRAAREEDVHAAALADLARAREAGSAARERLTRLLGVSGDATRYTLPERLPVLPDAADEPRDIEQRALDERLDVQAAKRDVEQTASRLGLTRATRFVNVLEIGAAHNSFGDGSIERGYQISVELPLFDFGDARAKKAEAIYLRALHRAAAAAVDAQSQVRQAYAAYRGRYALARHYRDRIVPLRKRISDETLLRYNGMLASVFELLADARSQIDGVRGAIDAERDFWLAEADLRMAMSGPPIEAALESMP